MSPEDLTDEQKENYKKAIEQYRRHQEASALQLQKYLQKIKTEYKHKYPELLLIEKWEFEESYLKAVQSKSIDQMKKILTEVSPNIYSFNMIKPKFAEKLIEEVENYEKMES